MSSASFTGKQAEKRLRVLMISGHYPTERNPHANTFIKTQVDSLIAAGLDIEVIYPGAGPFLWRYISTWVRLFFKTLYRDYDIVHGHYGQWCLLARLQWTTPVVASFLGSDLLGDVTLEGRLTKKGKIITSVSRWLCRRVDAVTVKTEEMKKAASSNNVTVYSDGIDFELFHPIPRAEARRALGWDQDRYYILFGNNPQRAVKNYPLALTAIEILGANGVTAELVVASGLPQTVLVQYINASNALILSSISEGSPNIVKEAMACNVPVVSTNVGDVSEIISHTEGCSVCPPDPASLADALEKALRHPGPTTGRTAIAHLERSVIAEQIIAVYEQVVSKRRRIQTPVFEKEKAYGNNT